jgi:hypothetical protein
MLVFMAFLITAGGLALYAQSPDRPNNPQPNSNQRNNAQPNNPQPNNAQRNNAQPNNAQMKDGNGANPPLIEPWARSINNEAIMRKYQIQRERAQLDEREERMAFEEKQKALLQQLEALALAYKADSAGKVQDTVKQLYALRLEARRIDEKARAKMMEIDLLQQKEMDDAFNAWVAKIGTDKTEMDKFIKTFTEKPEAGRGGRN